MIAFAIPAPAPASTPAVPQPFPRPSAPFFTPPLDPYPWWRPPQGLLDLLDGNDTRAIEAALTEEERTQFRAVARDLRRLRRELAAASAAERSDVLRRLSALLAYTLGLCEAKQLATGMGGLFQIAFAPAQATDFDTILQECEAQLLALSEPTRGLGLIAAGGICIGVGVLCKLAADVL